MIATDQTTGLSRQDLMDYFDLIVRANSNYPIDTAGLAIGSSNPAAVLVANTVHYCSSGVAKQKTTAEVAFTATTHNIPALATAVQEVCYFVCVNAAGTLSLVMGAIASGAGNALLPERTAVADGLAILGYVRIAVVAAAPGAGTSFIAGTTHLDDARLVGSVATYVNFLGPGGAMPTFAAAK